MRMFCYEHYDVFLSDVFETGRFCCIYGDVVQSGLMSTYVDCSPGLVY